MMTNTTHHPSTDLLLSYSAGTTSPSHALCVATHLEYCQTCRNAHRRNNAIGGKLIEALANEENCEVESSLKSKVFDLLDSRASVEKSQEDTTEANVETGIPRALRRLIPQGFRALTWQMLGTTARACQLFSDDNGTKVGLLRLKPGGRIAKHTHMGKEYTVVLSGAFSDESGVYRAGDFLLLDSANSHSPVATKDAECVCLTLTEAPLQFTGWLFKLLNPWIRSQFQAS